jgi:ABC-type glutathione transport system ATPase component
MSQPPAHLPSARIKRRGLMLVISSPSGAGKSTIARNLLEHDTGLSLSVSVTTRPRRGSEIDGVHYQFKSHREFERMRDSEALLEWAEVHGNFYGTPREAAEDDGPAPHRSEVAVEIADRAGLAEMLHAERRSVWWPARSRSSQRGRMAVDDGDNAACAAGRGQRLDMAGGLRLPRARARCAAVQPALSRSAEVTASTPTSRRSSPMRPRPRWLRAPRQP